MFLRKAWKETKPTLSESRRANISVNFMLRLAIDSLTRVIAGYTLSPDGLL